MKNNDFDSELNIILLKTQIILQDLKEKNLLQFQFIFPRFGHKDHLEPC